MFRTRYIGIITLCSLMFVSELYADPVEEFGLGSRAAGMAGAYTSSSIGIDSVGTNPGGLALDPNPSIFFGYGFGYVNATINNISTKLNNTRGSTWGFAVPYHFRDMTAALGFAFYVPDQFLARITLQSSSNPHFVLLNNSLYRSAINPALSLRVGSWLSLGIGATFLTDVTGNGIVFNLGTIDGIKNGSGKLDIELPSKMAPQFGVIIKPIEALTIGFAHKESIGIDLSLDLVANINIGGIVSGDTTIKVDNTSTYYSPRRSTASLTYQIIDTLLLTGDVTWSDWSSYPGGITEIDIAINLDTAPSIAINNPQKPMFDDTWSSRIGTEWIFYQNENDYKLRGGYAYLPTPIPPQSGQTSFADNNRHLFSLGFGMTLDDYNFISNAPIHFDTALQWHSLIERNNIKDPTLYPGNNFTSSGDIIHFGISVKLGL